MNNPVQNPTSSERVVVGGQGAYEAESLPQEHGGPASAFRRMPYPEDPRHKSPALATVLSLMPGLGQIYIGYYEQGFVNILIVASLIALLHNGVGRLEPLFGFFLAFYWLFNLVDAYRKASFYNQALAGLGPMQLPKESGITPGRGSVAGGVALIVLGALFLAHTRFGYSLAWLEDWWPVALLLLGAYLVSRAVLDRRKESGGVK